LNWFPVSLIAEILQVSDSNEIIVANCFGCLDLFVKLGLTGEKGKRRLLSEFEEIL